MREVSTDGLDKLIPVIMSGGGGGGDILSGLGLGGGSDTGAPLWQKLLLGGMLGTGEIGNILEERKRASYQNMILDLIRHPEKLTAMVLKAQRPLDNALVQAINNRVQADLASRGLSQAPGVFAAEQSQAIAPFIQQNEQTAMQQVLASLGLPSGTFRQPENLSPLLTQFLRTFRTATPGGGGGATDTGLTFPQPADTGTPSGPGPWFGDVTLPDVSQGVPA